MPIWNPWHGCHKISPGCLNCYVYRRDEAVGRDASAVARTADFDLPVRRDRHWAYKLQPEGRTVFTCMTSDFFLEEADPWRPACWAMMRQRADLHFAIITKRIHRFAACIPPDWGQGYPNVSVYCTVENQDMADRRLPIYLTLPIRHKHICHEPMLGPICIEPYLASGQIEYVLCGGESGPRARPCRYEWVLDTRAQCIRQGVAFHFKQTGAVFVKDGRTYRIPRRLQQSQAALAGIDYDPHADHRMTSLLFEEAMGQLLNENPAYRPQVFKGLTYLTGWVGPRDFYTRPMTQTVSPDEPTWPLGTPAYRWSERVRFPVPAGYASYTLRANRVYALHSLYPSQSATLFTASVANSDQVFFERATDSLLYGEQIEAASGDASVLTDFKLFDTTDVRETRFDAGVWTPAEGQRTVRCTFSSPQSLNTLTLWDNPDPAQNVLAATLTLSTSHWPEAERKANETLMRHS